MARKNNIRSMRFSDDVIEMIESQQGRNFSEKFENLVTRCMWELPEKERQLADLEKLIEKRRKSLQDMNWDLERKLNIAYNAASDLAEKLMMLGRDL